ncbi:VQ motif-containing protein 11-like [Corylus avellana]|uniref:VQ motif-containing protein 11-like n=1 Tax=Corylus avellana TaxID=13451 RepID=UPI00286CAC84|nr:VQ motif-containing protein 11-like [Corylus avellana]
MASNANSNMHSPTYSSDPTSPNTTFVQADPSTFRAVVQRLTGAPDDPSAQKLPLTGKPKPAGTISAAEMGPRKPAFKLHERRHATKKLELDIDHSTAFNKHCMGRANFNNLGPSGPPLRPMIFSPVSPLEFYARGSPRTPREVEEEEERAIAEKGFYLHPSPLSTPRGSDPPELLPLFPLQSPSDHHS